jgi:ribonuclease VapC
VIVVDASAVLSVLLEESDNQQIAEILARAESLLMSPVNHWEVIARAQAIAGPAGAVEAEALMAALNIGISPATVEDSRGAARAFARFGRRTAAGLKLGDCFAYALARSLGAPLLYKGEDFTKTGIQRAAAGP